jgi:hypothetical protein
MLPSELFKALMIAGDWDSNGLTEYISNNTSKGISLDGIKRWMHNNTIPKGENRQALNKAIFFYCKDSEAIDPQHWQNALYQSWIRYSADVKNISKLIRQRVLSDTRFTHLPPLFVSTPSLPLNTHYIELKLEVDRLSLNHSANKKYQPIELLDSSSKLSCLILGEPGSGKSSLINRITTDIALGGWKNAKIPLPINAKEFQLAQSKNPNLDLISFACRNFFFTEPQDLQFYERAKHSLMQEKIILLVDGIDEISNDTKTVVSLYTELRSLRGTVNWIVTARPTGLKDSLYEDQRFWIAKLDNLIIEDSIQKWVNQYNLDPHLKYSIFNNSRILKLVHNPFFLTVFYQAQLNIKHQYLSASPIAIQEFIFESIQSQAKSSHPEKNVLSIDIINKLQNFSLKLSAQSQHLPSYFNERNWWAHTSKHHSPHSLDDFYLQVLPSRLISSSHTNNFRFIHEGLQQQMNAHAMINLQIEEILAKRLSKQWRASFIAHASLCYYTNNNRFITIVETLKNDLEINHYSIILLADIYIFSGINNTKSKEEADLRARLYQLHFLTNNQPITTLVALAQLDPYGLEQQVFNTMKAPTCSSLSLPSTKDNHSLLNEHKLTAYLKLFDKKTNNYDVLSLINRASSHRVIEQAFWSDDCYTAISSTRAYAKIALPSDREKVILYSLNPSLSHLDSLKLYLFFKESPDVRFIPFLITLAKYSLTLPSPIFCEICQQLAKLSNQKTPAIFKELLLQNAIPLQNNSDYFKGLLSAIEYLPASDIQQVLDENILHIYCQKYAIRIRSLLLMCRENYEAALSKAILESHELSSLICTISSAITKNSFHLDSVLYELNRKIINNVNVETFHLIESLSNIELHQLKNKKDAILSPSLLMYCRKICQLVIKDINAQQSDYLLKLLKCLFEVLILSPFPGVEIEIINLLFHSKKNKALEVAIYFSGKMFSNQENEIILTKLKSILYSDNKALYQAAALAIGNISLDALNRFQDAKGAKGTLAKLALKKEHLIFKEYWCDNSGVTSQWQYPPTEICYIFDEEVMPPLAQIFAHEMSRYGFCVSKDISQSKFYLLFNPHTPESEQQTEIALLNCENRNSKQCLFYIPKGLPTPLARKLAQSVAQILAMKRHNRFSKSTFDTLSLT